MTQAALLDRKQVDFLYWHAVTKMRSADFEGAQALFRLLHRVHPERADAGLGHLYCLIRLGDLERAASVVATLRRRPLRPDEMALLGRLHRRCEFERERSSTRARSKAHRPGPGAEPVNLPHTLGDDAMARRALDQGAQALMGATR